MNMLRVVRIVINVVRMDFWMVKKDIRMARKVTMVVTASKNLDFAEQ